MAMLSYLDEMLAVSTT